MQLIKLTEENIYEHIGRFILYKTRGTLHMSKFINVNTSGKTIIVDNLDLKNCLSINRTIYVVLDW